MSQAVVKTVSQEDFPHPQDCPDGWPAMIEKRFGDIMCGVEELPKLWQQFADCQLEKQRELSTSLEGLERRLAQIVAAPGGSQEDGTKSSPGYTCESRSMEGRSQSRLTERFPNSQTRKSYRRISVATVSPEDVFDVENEEDKEDKEKDLKSLHEAQNWEMHHRDSEVSRKPSAGTASSHLDWRGSEVSVALDVASGVLVILNALSMAIELEWQGAQNAGSLGLGAATIFPQSAHDLFIWSEVIFCIIFGIEIVVRICAQGRVFFKNIWNLIDAVVVLISVADELFLRSNGMGVIDVKLLRIFRLVRLAKAVRVVRLIKFIHPLRVLLVSIASSFGSLFWSMVLITVVQAISAVAITQVVHEFITDESNDVELRRQVFAWFGKWSYSMLTMFELSLAPGAWAKPGRLLMFEVDPLYAFFFIPYVWCVSFAVLRVTAAMFVSQTMAATSKDDDLVFQAALKKHDKEVEEVRDIFQSADVNGDGKLTIDDFDELIVKQPRMRLWIADLGLTTSEVSGLFKLMDDGDGFVTFEEFLSGLMRLRGGAKSIDLATLLYENRRILMKLEGVKKAVIATRDPYACCEDALPFEFTCEQPTRIGI